MKKITGIFSLLAFISLAVPALAQHNYSWLDNYNPPSGLMYRVACPEGYERLQVKENSLEDWLRHFPVKEGRPEVKLYNGNLKGNQSAHYLVLDIDVGNKDLQQCADAVMRLKAEYHFACGEYQTIHFNFTSGDRADYQRWKAGYRPRISGNNVSWVKSAGTDGSYASFRRYMDIVFSYAGTFSLEKELIPVNDISDIRAGDVFIKGGFPGHAVMVMDVAVNQSTGKKMFLLAQSYMPAQEMHILRNPANGPENPWYEAVTGYLQTPEWGFPEGSLKRFAE